VKTKEFFVLYLHNLLRNSTFIFRMKRIFTISFALLVLISGMHISLATHICGGEVAAVKWSFSEEKASCGMETSKNDCPEQNTIKSNCCSNHISVLAVDNNYNLSSIQLKEVTLSLLQVFYVPTSLSFHSSIASSLIVDNFIPPNIGLTSAVSLADICIFRI
jgi:hypothetical protein